MNLFYKIFEKISQIFLKIISLNYKTNHKFQNKNQVTNTYTILSFLKNKNIYPNLIIDVGCGGGQFVEELALRVGLEGLAIGVDPSEAQLSTAEASCNYLQNTKFSSCSADKIDLDSSSCDAVTFTQTLNPNIMSMSRSEN